MLGYIEYTLQKKNAFKKLEMEVFDVRVSVFSEIAQCEADYDTFLVHWRYDLPCTGRKGAQEDPFPVEITQPSRVTLETNRPFTFVHYFYAL